MELETEWEEVRSASRKCVVWKVRERKPAPPGWGCREGFPVHKKPRSQGSMVFHARTRADMGAARSGLGSSCLGFGEGPGHFHSLVWFWSLRLGWLDPSSEILHCDPRNTNKMWAPAVRSFTLKATLLGGSDCPCVTEGRTGGVQRLRYLEKPV